MTERTEQIAPITKLPDYWWEWDCYNDIRSDTSVYSKDEIDEWFKRCIADFPEFMPGYNPAGAKAQRWFEKWFSQLQSSEKTAEAET